jgi:hypothetical protein
MRLFDSTAPWLRPVMVEYPSYTWSPIRLTYIAGSAEPRLGEPTRTGVCQRPPAGTIILTLSFGSSLTLAWASLLTVHAECSKVSWAAARVGIAQTHDITIKQRPQNDHEVFLPHAGAVVQRLPDT